MFNKSIATLLLALMTLGATSAFAQTAPRVAVVDVQRAILGSSYGQAQLEALEADPEYAELQASILSLQTDIETLDKEAEQNAASWTEARFATYNKNRQFKVADLQLAQQKIQSEQERVIAEINAAMSEQAQAALQQLITDEGVTLLLRETAVYYATPEHDLTGKLAAKLSQ